VWWWVLAVLVDHPRQELKDKMAVRAMWPGLVQLLLVEPKVVMYLVAKFRAEVHLAEPTMP
jgi:hypothetical protein